MDRILTGEQARNLRSGRFCCNLSAMHFLRFFICAVLLFHSTVSFAFETDQYNLPETPLADIGDEVAEYTEDNIRKAVSKVNAKIAASQSCLEKQTNRKNCDSDTEEREKLAELRSENAIIREVFKPLGGGIPPFTNSGTWMEKHEFRAAPARFKTSYKNSIYYTAPINYLTISDTVNLYGFEFGTDKIAHFFQQGYTYYKTFQKNRAKGLSEKEAARKAFGTGKFTEKTYYGMFVSGVYSNADLAANYVGMKFYENLTLEIKIGKETKPPILVLKNGFWAFNENINVREAVLKPFLSNHLNEARNPSVYFNIFGFRSYIRKIVRKQACPQWKEHFPNVSAADYKAETDSLITWHGEDYGAKNSTKRITIAETCF